MFHKQIRRETLNKLKALLESYDHVNILDCGTGRGEFISLLSYVSNQYDEILGIDNNPRAIEVASQSFDDDRIKFMTLDINDIPVLDKKFHIISLSNSLHHLMDIHETMDVMFEGLEPDGVLLFNEMYCDQLNEKQKTHMLLHHFWAKADRYDGIVHNNTMPREKIISILQHHEKTHSLEVWDMESPSQEEIPDEAYDMLKNSVQRALNRLPNDQKHQEEGEALIHRIDEVGFDSAPQLVVIVRKK